MPMKYFYEMPEPNFYIGMAHGLLFLFYCALGLSCAIQYQWKIGFSVMVFLASLIPLGTFLSRSKVPKGITCSIAYSLDHGCPRFVEQQHVNQC